MVGLDSLGSLFVMRLPWVLFVCSIASNSVPYFLMCLYKRSHKGGSFSLCLPFAAVGVHEEITWMSLLFSFRTALSVLQFSFDLEISYGIIFYTYFTPMPRTAIDAAVHKMHLVRMGQLLETLHQ